MDSVRVLMLKNTAKMSARLEHAIHEVGFQLEILSSNDPQRDLAGRVDFEIFVLHLPTADAALERLIASLRSNVIGAPLQIIALADSEPEYRIAVDMGADDVISSMASELELSARLRAAAFRLSNQERLLREREFFRQAVREEEAVNARILDRNRVLTEACRSLESMKRVLERSNEQLQKVARFDMLSGLLNRVSLFSTMDSEIERSVRSGSPLAGFMTDIDNFKNINDNWGHPSGDEVIRTVGKRMSESLRKYDHAGRYGGEEFFVVLPNAGIEGAKLIAERFRSNLSSEPVSFGDDNLLVTASIGVAEFKPTEARDVWITRADQAMYLAKQQGRNRVCVMS
jgi:diguanylate cyclase (GGDEF)-like protein